MKGTTRFFVFGLLNLAAVALGKPHISDVPEILVQQDRSSKSIPEIQVTFPNGHRDNLVLHKHYSSKLQKNSTKEYCHYLGHLEKDDQACVAVTGCVGEEMDFTISSKHNTVTNLYHMDKLGQVHAISPLSLKNHGVISELGGGDDEALDSTELPEMVEYVKKCSSGNTSDCYPAPETNLLDLKIAYEDTFLESFPDSEAARDYIYQLLTHVQAAYCASTLGTKIQFQVNEIQHFPGRSWKAIPRNFIEPELYYLTEDHIGGNDLIAYLAYPPPDTGDSTGYGWIGYVCNRIDVGRRHSLSEKQTVFLNTVYLLSHELGHNLGMFHDHEPEHLQRGCNLKGIKGIMSYEWGVVDRWSDCSRTDFIALYNRVKHQWCMPEAPGACAPPPTPSTTTTTTTTASTTTTTTTTTTPPKKCIPLENHPTWFRDGFCDPLFNTPECGFDGGDCCLKKKPTWDDYCNGGDCECHGFDCPEYPNRNGDAGDGYCYPLMNNPGCFYDYGDCCENKVANTYQCNSYPTKCQCLDPLVDQTTTTTTTTTMTTTTTTTTTMKKCAAYEIHPLWYRDGYCDPSFNIPECYYDGGDCCLKTSDDWDAYCNEGDCGCHGLDCPKYETDPEWMSDGYCDPDMNNPGCFFDHGDCCDMKTDGWENWCNDACDCLDPLSENFEIIG